jgi:3-deoxy-D-manno-octulosonic-acid transferase
VHGVLRAIYGVAGSLATSVGELVPDRETAKWARALHARRGAIDRFAQWSRSHRDAGRPLLWMHAPSVGEGLQARVVLERLRSTRPDLQVAYTHFSPSAQHFAETLREQGVVDVADYLPLDTAMAADAMLAALSPTALVFAKLDVWPLLAERAAARGVRLGMISATMAAHSSRRTRAAAALLRDAHAAMHAVGAISDADGDRLVALGVPAQAITVTGDTRYDQVWARAQSALESGRALIPAARSAEWARQCTLVAGSTWPSDESVLLEGWDAVRARDVPLRLIVAPHEPTESRLRALEQWADSRGARHARLGRLTGTDTDGANVSPQHAMAPDLILVDRVGVLADLYALADVAYVGGGFHKAGLHSVLEPAACGVPVLIGPRSESSRDAELLLDARAGHRVRTAAELATQCLTWVGTPHVRRAAGERAREVVRHGLGAADKSVALVERLL